MNYTGKFGIIKLHATSFLSLRERIKERGFNVDGRNKNEQTVDTISQKNEKRSH